jgi:anti-anti-sigma factor
MRGRSNVRVLHLRKPPHRVHDGFMTGFACGTLTDPDGPTVVWAAGHVDLTVAARLGAEIEPRLRPGASVVLYCAAITAMDSAGPRVLQHASQLAAQVHASFALAEVPKPVSEVLDAAGMAPAFTVFDDLADAKAAASRI